MVMCGQLINQDSVWASLNNLSLYGLKSLKLRECYKYSLRGQGFQLVAFHLEKESQSFLHSKTHFMEYQGLGKSHQMKDFGCTRHPQTINFFFINLDLIQEHPNHWYEFSISYLYSKMVFKAIIFHYIRYFEKFDFHF